jgi:hypothetical protein
LGSDPNAIPKVSAHVAPLSYSFCLGDVNWTPACSVRPSGLDWISIVRSPGTQCPLHLHWFDETRNGLLVLVLLHVKNERRYLSAKSVVAFPEVVRFLMQFSMARVVRSLANGRFDVLVLVLRW